MLALRVLSRNQHLACHLQSRALLVSRRGVHSALSPHRDERCITTGTHAPQHIRVRQSSELAVSATKSLAPVLPTAAASSESVAFAKSLPVVCPGCGAFSQTVDPESPGFYARKGAGKNTRTRQKEQEELRIAQEAMTRLQNLDGDHVKSESSDSSDINNQPAPSTPLCNRCHDLIYQSKGQSIVHPSMQSIRTMIEASPHKRNHIYHVLDAADFPMSLIPNLTSALNLPHLRTQNRRSRLVRYYKGRTAEVSFIITRSDLLAPMKEQVDRKMPYLQEVLRDALGRSGRNARLGNVRCVSAKRGWWTPSVKKEIWDRGGAGWVVGKVNVGKSALFEVVYPKGRTLDPDVEARMKAVRRAGEENSRPTSPMAVEGQVEPESLSDPMSTASEQLNLTQSQMQVETDEALVQQFNSDDHDTSQQSAVEVQSQDTAVDRLADAVSSDQGLGDHILSAESLLGEDLVDDDIEEVDLLPPAQLETNYPRMPTVSSLPGTTASPIRIPYGRGRGELIDLPGIERSTLETHVKPEHRKSLIMHHRIVPEQHTIKPGQSLLIGGMIRIEPKTEDLIFLAYPFTTLQGHSTRTDKAIAIQTGVDDDLSAYEGNVQSIAVDSSKSLMQSAGTFSLEWDVTKQRTGSLTDRAAGKRKVADLPFTIYSADILIEGVGWVELACQVRNRRREFAQDPFSAELDNPPTSHDHIPRVEIFSPEGKYVDIRRPMNAWITGGPKKVPKHKQRLRPRMSISMHRRREGGKLGGQKKSSE